MLELPGVTNKVTLLVANCIDEVTLASHQGTQASFATKGWDWHPMNRRLALTIGTVSEALQAVLVGLLWLLGDSLHHAFRYIPSSWTWGRHPRADRRGGSGRWPVDRLVARNRRVGNGGIGRKR